MDQAVDQLLLSQLNQIVRTAVSHVLICDNSGSGEAYGGLAVDFADFTDYHTYGDLHFLEPTLDHWRREWQTPRPWIFGEFVIRMIFAIWPKLAWRMAVQNHGG